MRRPPGTEATHNRQLLPISLTRPPTTGAIGRLGLGHGYGHGYGYGYESNPKHDT